MLPTLILIWGLCVCLCASFFFSNTRRVFEGNKSNNYSHCIINQLIAKHAVIPSHFPVSARADCVSNALRHFKFGLSAGRVVFSSVIHKDSRLLRPTSLPWWRLTKPLHTLILVAFLLPHQSRTLPHNLILCDEVMSIQ